MNVLANNAVTSEQHQDELSTDTIASGFSRAAKSYDKIAGIQKRIATDALANLNANTHHRVLDLGCGTGRHTAQLCQISRQVTGIDIAAGMLEQAKQQAPKARFVQADAQNLPFSANQFERVFSSMALQWCEQLERVAGQIQRVLTLGGEASLAIMTADSFTELSRAQHTLGMADTVNALPSEALWTKAFQQAGLSLKKVDTLSYFDEYHSILPLLRSISQVGASTQTRELPSTVTKPLSRAQLHKLEVVMRNQHPHQTLGLTYRVSHFVLAK